MLYFWWFFMLQWLLVAKTAVEANYVEIVELAAMCYNFLYYALCFKWFVSCAWFLYLSGVNLLNA